MDFSSNKENHSRIMEVETSNVIDGKFGMFNKPIDVQITIHVNNLISTYNTKDIVAAFKEKLNNPEYSSGVTITRLIDHYGLKAMQDWFSSIYGWEFNKKVG